MMDEADEVPTPEDLRQAMEQAVRRRLMKANRDDTFSITDAGKEWVEEFVLAARTIH